MLLTARQRRSAPGTMGRRCFREGQSRGAVGSPVSARRACQAGLTSWKAPRYEGHKVVHVPNGHAGGVPYSTVKLRDSCESNKSEGCRPAHSLCLTYFVPRTLGRYLAGLGYGVPFPSRSDHGRDNYPAYLFREAGRSPEALPRRPQFRWNLDLVPAVVLYRKARSASLPAAAAPQKRARPNSINMSRT